MTYTIRESSRLKCCEEFRKLNWSVASKAFPWKGSVSWAKKGLILLRLDLIVNRGYRCVSCTVSNLERSCELCIKLTKRCFFRFQFPHKTYFIQFNIYRVVIPTRGLMMTARTLAVLQGSPSMLDIVGFRVAFLLCIVDKSASIPYIFEVVSE